MRRIFVTYFLSGNCHTKLSQSMSNCFQLGSVLMALFSVQSSVLRLLIRLVVWSQGFTQFDAVSFGFSSSSTLYTPLEHYFSLVSVSTQFSSML